MFFYILAGILLVMLAGCGQLKGQSGATGPAGAPGAPAKPCVVTIVTNGVQIACPGSAPETVYNGSSVAPVQFCQGIQTVYPNSFPEFGLCVSGTLYGVYYDGTNAWMAQIVPGVYKSTATGLQCTFSVGNNCEVTD